MKVMTKVILIIVMLFTMSNVSGAKFEDCSMLPIDQGPALHAYSEIRKTFDLSKQGHIVAYPNEYGGCYIDGETLIVLITREGEALVTAYTEIAQSKHLPISIQLCERSLNECRLLMNTFLKEVGTEKLYCSYYSPLENAYILETDSEHKAELNDSLNCFMQRNGAVDSIRIRVALYTEPNSLETSHNYRDNSNALTGGRLLYCGNSHIGTLGISGTFDTWINNVHVTSDLCYLTAGHVAQNGNVGPLIYNWNQFSSLLCQFEDYEAGDYAVVPASSSFSLSNNVYCSNSLATMSISNYYCDISEGYPCGTIVYKFGQTTLLTYGHVVLQDFQSYPYYYNEYNSINPTGMIVVEAYEDNSGPSYMSAEGDSGGPCWVFANSAPVLIGIVSGGVSTTGNNVYSNRTYVSPIDLAVNDGFVPYLMSGIQLWND